MDTKFTDAGKVLATKADFKEVGLNFVGSAEPTNPEEGQSWYDSTNNLIKFYDGSSWTSIAVFIGTAAPGTPVEGMLWYDTTNNLLKSYDGGAWVTYALHIGTAAPGTPTEGHLWYNTTNNVLEVYDGSTWTIIPFHVGASVPSVINVGHLWYDTTNKRVRLFDGTNWSSIVPLSQTATPGNPVDGQLWYDITANTLKVWNDGDSAWDVIGPPNSTTLDTDIEELSYDISDEGGYVFVLSSPGEYGFFPQTKWESGVGTKNVTYGGGAANSGGTSYTSEILMGHTSGSDKYGYVQTRYVTSSGNIGWLFILKEKGKKRIRGSYFCFDHPSWGRGGDPEQWPHPWKNLYDPQKHEIYCVTMNREDVRIISYQNVNKSFLELINEQYEICEENQSQWPDHEIPVYAIKNIGHIKKVVKKPAYIKMAGLKKRVM